MISLTLNTQSIAFSPRLTSIGRQVAADSKIEMSLYLVIDAYEPGKGTMRLSYHINTMRLFGSRQVFWQPGPSKPMDCCAPN